jgi:hypothetical protein
LLHFAASVGRLRAAWRRLPSEFRREVMAHYAGLDHGGEDWGWRIIEEQGLFPE